MLKTSPVLSSSSNTSPTTFRYAPATSQPSPVLSPRDLAARLRRSSSKSSRPSPTLIMSPATRDPMRSAPSSSAVSIAAVQPVSGSGSSIDEDQCSDKAPQHGSTSSLAAAAAKDPAQSSDVSTSPAKRRGSSTPERAAASSSSTQTAPPAAAAEPNLQQTQPSKRLRADTRPEKVLPQKYELCPVEDMVELIAHMLAELIATNDAIGTSSGGLTRFHSRTAPGISVRDYLHRLAKHATLTQPLLLVIVYYIDRLCAMYPEFTINTLTVHRFLITAAAVAAKGLSDSFWNNTTYARVGGVRVAELKLLELEFLYRVDWKIVPNPEVLVAYYEGLVERTPGYTLEVDDDEDNDDDDIGEDDETLT